MYLIECIAGPEDGRVVARESLPQPNEIVMVNGSPYRFWALKNVLVYYGRLNG